MLFFRWKNSIFFYLLCIAYSTSVWAEESSGEMWKQKISLGFVFNQYQIRDEVLTRLRWLGAGPGLSLGYEYSNTQQIHEVETDWRLNVAVNRFEHLAGAINVKTHYVFLQRFASTRLHDPYWGVQFNHNTRHAYFGSWDDAHLYWFDELSVGPSLAFSKPIADRSFAFRFHIPVIARIYRPPRHRFTKVEPMSDILYWLDKRNGESYNATIDSFRSVNLKVTFLPRTPDVQRHQFSYEFEYSRFDKPKTVSVINHAIHYRYNWSW